MQDETLVFDIEGYDIGIGILRVEDGCYKSYQGDKLIEGANRLLNAKHIVSFNGTNPEKYDQEELRKLLSLTPSDPLPFKGTHDDMMLIGWREGYFGIGLRDMYLIRFKEKLLAPDISRGHLLNDVLATYRLWKCWKEGILFAGDFEDKGSAIENAKSVMLQRGVE